MALTKTLITNIRGIQGHSVSTASIEEDDHLRLTLTSGDTVDAGVARGPQGLAGVNAVENDTAVAGYISTTGTSATKTALDAALGAFVAPALVPVSLASLRVPRFFPLPASLSFPRAVSIYRDALGVYHTDVDPESLHTPGAGPTYYVDQAIGSNSNDGLSWATPFADPGYASLKNSSNGTTILIKAGHYNRSSIPAIRNKNLAIKAFPGDRVIITACDVLTGWGTAGGGAYITTQATVNGVLDKKRLDARGEPKDLTNAASSAAVIATPGTWYTDGTSVWVNLTDGRVPDTHVLVSRSVNMLRYDGAYTGDGGSLYLEGLEFWGGTTSNFTATGATQRLYAKNTKFKYAQTTNGLSVLGLSEVVLVGGEASFNYLDGFSYHDNAGRTGVVIEVDCVGYSNGKIVGSQNGSTTHETYKTVRVGGVHSGNQGANIADVNSTKSFNVGVRAGDSLDYKQDFFGAYMILVECESSSDTAFASDPSAPDGVGSVRVRDGLSIGGTTGSVTAY
jgi:hypothetical protein